MATQQMINYASCSSSSCVASLKKHDVFLSFRGEDTRDNFTSHLYDALNHTKLEIYIDYRLQKGDEISQALIEAIQESQVSVVIFSQNYATSKWCLDEITKIIECKELQGQVVIPVFYKVDPSHVRRQRESFEQAFTEHERDPKITKEQVKNWRTALTKAANLAGWDSLTYRTEAEFIKDIVKDVLQKLNLINPIELKGVIGIERNCARIKSLLEIDSIEVRVIGIWGMGGIGKTTLAIALHAKLFSQFEAHCFLSNVREQSEKLGLDVLRRTLFSELFPGENLPAHVPKVESHFITRRLRHKKVFLVLDDVASSDQLEDLISDFGCLGPGSRVLVTTRDKHIFSHVDEIYEVEELKDQDSLQLFCLNAFRENHPKNGFEELSDSVIAYCKGNPLALKVLGARLRSRSEQAWKSELRKLQKIPNLKIHNVLKMSFDDLDSTEQEIFLDIACFLKGEARDHIISLLEACNLFPAIGIEVLADKSLITISRTDTIEMHDLIQEMGWNIVHQESIEDPGKQSRLWDSEEVYNVLKYNRGTGAIEGIKLDLSKIKDLHLSFDSFAKMTNIRFLKFYHGEEWSSTCKIYLPKNGLKALPDKLRYLHWHGYCLDSLPSTFSAKLLVELSMPNSNLEKLWDGVQNLVNLKGIDLRFCENLAEIPDLSMATNLKQLTLFNCTSLSQVHPSILSLPKLEILDLAGCTEIQSLQSDVHLKSLRSLRLSNCSSLKEFSVSSVELKRLWLDGTHIQELPLSLWNCVKLRLINVQGCNKLDCLGDKLSYDQRTASCHHLVLSGCKQLNASNLHFIHGLQGLTYLELENCCNLRTLPDSIGLLSSLQGLKLGGSNVESLPASINNLLMLRSLYLDNCMKLVSLPQLPQTLWLLSAANCTSLVTNFTQLNKPFQLKSGLEEHPQSVLVPGALVPDWFSFHAEGASHTLPHLPLAGLCGFVFCLVLSESPPNRKYRYVEYFIYKNSKRVDDHKPSVVNQNLSLDHVFFIFLNITYGGDHSILRSLQEGEACDPSNISFKFSMKHEGGEWSSKMIKWSGVYPVYAFDESHVKVFNHNNEDDQTKKLQQVMRQTITTGVQHLKVDSNEYSSCHSFIVSTAGGTKRKPQSFKEEDYYISSTPENQINPIDTPCSSNIDSSQIIEVLEEKYLTYNQVDECSDPVMFEKVLALVENNNLHLEPVLDPIAEAAEHEGMLCDSYKNFPMSTLSTVSETEVQGPNVTVILEKLETLLETSLETISSDDEVKQQFHLVLDQLVQFEDQVPVKLRPVIKKSKTFIEGLDVGFVTAQKTIKDYDQLLHSRSLLSKHLERFKARQYHINSKVSEGKIQFEKINYEVVELEQKISVLVETRDKLKRDLDNCDVENNKLKTEVAKLVSKGKTVITALKDSKTSYNVALTNRNKAEDEWADLKKTFVDKRF